ncbi:protein kinase domain-containing protein [Nostoc sp.]|uniref:protein kinase domain-containing protein n=1 Tax=Nostoc sp. TaxID=1180 RepID=UPI002FF63192
MIGYILRQRYKIVNKLGAGGFGETYLAEYLQDLPVSPKYKCVIKRLIRPPTPDLDTEQRFKKEAAILFKLGKEHPQIPELYDFFEENREFYLVQEFIEGHDLSKEIISGKPWSEADVIQLLQETLEVLAFVHQHNVIHRDIKPLNLMRRYLDNRLVLIDFGAIKEISTFKINIQGQISSTITIGTRDYMPSEQWEGHPQLCSDIYALGMTAIQALTGLTPQQLPKSETLELRWHNYVQISDGLAIFLTKMVQRDFRQRYKNAEQALQALKLALFNPQSSVTPVRIQALKLAQLVLQLSVASLKLVKIGNKYGYVDQAGKLVIQVQFDIAHDFSEGWAAVNIGARKSLFGDGSGGKWGYIDKRGSWVIKPMFNMAYSLRDGQAKVEIGGQERIIDKIGMFID